MVDRDHVEDREETTGQNEEWSRGAERIFNRGYGYGRDRNAGLDRADTVGRPYPRANERFQYDGWRRPGPYTGYGPADYEQPEDERIMEEVNERLMQNGRLNALGISVVVEDGKVSLQGVVSSERDRHIAENVAQSVPGVRRVYDRLRISGDLHSQPPTE